MPTKHVYPKIRVRIVRNLKTSRKKRKEEAREDVKGEKDTDKKEEEEYKPKLKPL